MRRGDCAAVHTIENLAHLPTNDLGGERFLDERGARWKTAAAQQRVVDVAGHDQNLGVEAKPVNAVDQFPSTHMRHHEIREHEVYIMPVLDRASDRLRTVARLEHLVAPVSYTHLT